MKQWLNVRKVVEINPNFVEACYELGNALLQLERTDEAIEAYNMAIARKPDQFRAWYRKALCFLNL
jgi:tetratricopeptide (TPR) repeat protein